MTTTRGFWHWLMLSTVAILDFFAGDDWND